MEDDTTPAPDWSTYPNLDGKVTEDMVKKKAGKFDYVEHMQTAQVIRTHAPGWQFALKKTADGDHIWQAPNGTGFIIGYFKAPIGSGFPDTQEYPYAIIDFKNKAVAYESIDARTFCDNERRCLCATASRFLGVAYELWAEVDLESDSENESPHPVTITKELPEKRQTPVTKPTKETAPPTQPARPSQDPFKARKATCKEQLTIAYKTDKDIVTKWRTALKLRFDGVIDAEKPTVENLLTEEQIAWCEEWIKLKLDQ